MSEKNEKMNENIEDTEECKEYIDAINFYEKQMEGYDNYKVHDADLIEEETKNIYTLQIANVNKFNRSDFIYEKLKISHCTEDEKLSIKQICNEFSQQFHIDGDPVGYTNVVTHHIKIIPGSKVVNIRQYRIPHKHREI